MLTWWAAASLLLGAQDEGDQLKALLEKQSSVVVTVDVVVKMEISAMGQSQDSESKRTVRGTVVDPSGLILLSSASFSMKRMNAIFSAQGAEMKATPTAFQVVVEREEKEYKAFLVATDDKLDLAFIQVEELGDRKLVAADFSKTVALGVGQKVAVVSRLEKGYDYAPCFRTGRVSGAVEKPRDAWVVDGGLSDLGLPVYGPTGEIGGVLAAIPSELKEEASGDQGMGMLSMLFGGGGAATNVFVLPAKTVDSRVGQARKQAAELIQERAKKEPEEKD